MNRKRFILISLFLILLLAACGGGDAESSYAYDTANGDDAAYAPMEEPRAAMDGGAYYDEEAAFDADTTTMPAANGVGSATGGEGATQNPTTEAQNQIQRLIIRNGYMSVDVVDTEAAIADISALADTMGGWVVSTEVNQYGDSKSGNIIIRVEAQQFDAAMVQIRELAVSVNSESTSGQDVTEEYVDLSARLQNLESTAERVRTFLDEARNTEDALAVNRELSQLESEIEIIKGRLNYLSQSAAYSTINVSLFPDEASEPVEVDRWQPGVVVKQSFEALVTTLQILANLVIGFTVFLLPLLLLVIVPLYVLFLIVRRRRRRARPAAATE